jgi:hypothetical protein
MPCESFQDALIEAAASGEEPRGELRAHLRDCAACRAAFEQEQSLFAAMDSGLRSLANAEVPPSLLPRVRAAIDDAAVPSGAWSPKWFVLAGAGAALAFFITNQTFWRARIDLNPSRPSADMEQTAPPFKFSAEGPLNAVAAPHLAPVIRPGAHLERSPLQHGDSKAEAQPEILVPRDQEVLLARYAEDLRHKGAPVLRTEANDSTLVPLEVAPIQIAELDVKLLAESKSQ